MQSLITLLPLGIEQNSYAMSNGYGASKAFYTHQPAQLDSGKLPSAQTLVWIRMVGDITAGLGMGSLPSS